MFSLSSSNHFEYYSKPCDMRKGFDGLCGIVCNELGREATNGEVFVFINRSRNTIKLLHWETDGLVIYHKRLEKGTFSVPTISAGKTQIRWPELVLMLEGIKTVDLIRKPRYIM